MSDFKPGDRVRVKKTGEVIHLDDVNDNPNYAADDELFADGWSVHGSVTIMSPDEIEKVDWAAPTAEQLASVLASGLHHFGEDIEVHETSQEGEGLVAVLAKWKGAEGGFYVRFGVWREDML